jgi:hypothetical protein
LRLKAEAEQMARDDRTTLDQLNVSDVAEKLLAMTTSNYFAQRAIY